jgi:monothiol glutaredoxin
MHTALQKEIDNLIKTHDILVFIKGSKEQPMCGFSNTVVQIMNQLGVKYHAVNVLENINIREGIKEYSSWPTIPQVYIQDQFIGGADILLEKYKSRQLHEIVEMLYNA